MNMIQGYVMEYRRREIVAGRNPTTVRLTKEQIEYYEDWLRENRVPLVADPKLDGKRQIQGLEVIEV